MTVTTDGAVSQAMAIHIQLPAAEIQIPKDGFIVNR
jgi:hypothetical protein